MVKARSRFANEPTVQKKASALSIAEICFGHEHEHEHQNRDTVMEKLGGDHFFSAFNKVCALCCDYAVTVL